MKSQLLMGEVVLILGRRADGGWLKVRNLADGYSGWVKAWGVVEATRRRAAAWVRLARVRVALPMVQIRVRAGAGSVVSPLFWRSLVIRGARWGRFLRVELPDGRRGWGLAAGFEPAGGPGCALRDRIQSLLGTPYLWGGRTALGLDCSGFTQLVLAEQGAALPRDSFQQFRAVRALRSGEDPREGDLMFFGRPGKPPSHVGIALGGGWFAHVRGWVRIASLEPSNPMCDNEIATQYRGCGRPRAGPRGGGGRQPGGRESA